MNPGRRGFSFHRLDDPREPARRNDKGEAAPPRILLVGARGFEPRPGPAALAAHAHPPPADRFARGRAKLGLPARHRRSEARIPPLSPERQRGGSASPDPVGRGERIRTSPRARGAGCARPSASGGPLRTRACEAWATCAPSPIGGSNPAPFTGTTKGRQRLPGSCWSGREDSNLAQGPRRWLRTPIRLRRTASHAGVRSLGYLRAIADRRLESRPFRRNDKGEAAPPRILLVGARGFEPPTSRSRTERSTRLSHAPTKNEY
ncbi:hypothetical protein METESE_27270 [Mesoterricola sediminis]|uniref:Uncharacterized protein n=1 Tax=Mesoterricola sediminis TaxID=2927980 RepID=A0AA48GU26_9BACT|nr:hypothetical protein METESE_27270 [Mesoterricola sediminis]